MSTEEFETFNDLLDKIEAQAASVERLERRVADLENQLRRKDRREEDELREMLVRPVVRVQDIFSDEAIPERHPAWPFK